MTEGRAAEPGPNRLVGLIAEVNAKAPPLVKGKSKKKRTTPPGADAGCGRAAGDASAAPLGEKRGRETQRRWLLAAAPALLVVMPLVPGELGAVTGQGLLVPILWLLVAALSVLYALGQKRFALRFAWIDAAVVALVAWHTAAALRAVAFESPRPAMNMMWYWIGLAACYFTLRQLVRTAAERRALVALAITLTTAVALHGLYQYFYEIRQTQQMYEEDPDRVLREAGLWYEPGSPERKLFEDRLHTKQPTATFALTNSLAGHLAPWLVIGVGVLVLGAVGRRRTSLALRAAWGAALVAVGFCLYLTGSRTAQLATATGLFGIAWLTWRELATSAPARRAQRNTVVAAAGLFVILGASLAVAYALGEAGPVLRTTGPGRSLLYRLEYWDATSRMIADRPLFGCGPGNFQFAYTRYKLPEASEEIADPHNFLFEIGATAGLPALAAMIFVLACLARSAAVRPRQVGEVDGETEKQTTIRQESVAPDQDDRAVPFVLWGGAAGLLLAVPVGGAATPWIALLIAAVVFAVFLTSKIVNFFTLPSDQRERTNTSQASARTGCGPRRTLLLGAIHRNEFRCAIDDVSPGLLLVGMMVLLLHLLGAGGIGTQGLAVTFWVLLALAANGLERPDSCWKTLPRPVGVLLLLLLVALALTCQQTAYVPVTQCRAFLDRAGAAPRQGGTLAVEATRADPLSDEAWRMRAAYAATAWQIAPSAEAWDAVLMCRDRALKNTPRSASLRAMYGDIAMSSYASRLIGGAVHDWRDRFNELRRHASALAMRQEDPLLQMAAEDYGRAVSLYPNDPRLRADLAMVACLTGDRDLQQVHARRAVELDEIVRQAGHEDKRLDTTIRKRLRAWLEELDAPVGRP